jgi:hypothetical protein
MKIHIISTFYFTTFRRNLSMFWNIKNLYQLINFIFLCKISWFHHVILWLKYKATPPLPKGFLYHNFIFSQEKCQKVQWSIIRKRQVIDSKNKRIKKPFI